MVSGFVVPGDKAVNPAAYPGPWRPIEDAPLQEIYRQHSGCDQPHSRRSAQSRNLPADKADYLLACAYGDRWMVRRAYPANHDLHRAIPMPAGMEPPASGG